jgi:hypothetical protein
MDEKCLILKSLALNFPVWSEWNIQFPRMITLQLQKGKSAAAKSMLKNFKFEDSSFNSDFRFYTFAHTDRLETMAEQLYEQAKMADCTGGFPILLTEDMVIQDDNMHRFYIAMEDLKTLSFDAAQLAPKTEDLPAIHQKALAVLETELSVEEQVLQISAYFLEPFLYRTKSNLTIDDLLTEVHRICEKEENCRDTYDISNVFIRRLFEWQSETGYFKIFNRDESSVCEEEMSQTIFFDNTYFYISESFFKEIINPILEFVNVGAVKVCVK